jgi:hypothetical protein
VSGPGAAPQWDDTEEVVGSDAAPAWDDTADVPASTTEKVARGAAPLVGAAVGGGATELGRRGVEAAAPGLKNLAADAEFRAIGGLETPEGESVLKGQIQGTSDLTGRDVGRSSLDKGGMGLSSAEGYQQRLLKQGEANRGSIGSLILEQKALRDAKAGPVLNLLHPRESLDRLAGRLSRGALARGLDSAGNLAAKAGGRIARKLPIVGAALGGGLAYSSARADGESVPDALVSGAGNVVASVDPTGLLDATPTGPQRGSTEAKLESGDQLGFILDRAPERLKGVLTQAAKRGTQTLAVTHRLLMKKDPEYREAITGQGAGD